MEDRLIVYVKDEGGTDLPHAAAFERRLVELGAWHNVPGLGLGRECPGFVNRLDYSDAEGATVGFITTAAEPLRVVLWRPSKGEVGKYWLVAPNTPRSDVDRLRALSWPKAGAP